MESSSRAPSVAAHDGPQQALVQRIAELEAGLAAARADLARYGPDAGATLAVVECLAHVGSFRVDLVTGTTRWSEETYRIFGLTPDPQGRPEDIRAMIDPADRMALARAFVRTARRGELPAAPYQFRVTLPTGDERHVWLDCDLVRDGQGRPTAVVGALLDVTGQARMAAAHFEDAARLRALLSSVPACVWVVDRELVLRDIGGTDPRMSAAQWRETVRASLGRSLFEVFGYSEDHPVVVAHRRALTGERVEFEDVNEGRTFRCALEPVTALDGLPQLAVGVAHDVTAERELAEQRRQFEQRVQQAQKLESLGMLAGGVAHDFNNLLVGVLANTNLVQELLTGLATPPEVARALQHVELASRRAAELTRQLLTYAGKAELRMARVDLALAVQELTALLAPSVAGRAEVELIVEPTAVHVDGDPAQLRQVIMNLVLNAADACAGRGRVRVRVGVQPFDEAFFEGAFLRGGLGAGSHAFVCVEDEGIGMDASTRARMFDPFFTSKSAGRGLGLAAVLGVIRAHEAAIRVDSWPGVGTRAWVVLRRSSAAGGAATPEAAAEARRRDPEAAALEVLVVDDEPLVRDVMTTLLRRTGARVTGASDGSEAIAALTTHRFDGVVLDLTMPGLSGEALIRRVTEVAPGTPVLLVSGYTADRAPDLARLPGVRQFLQKPFTSREFREAIAAAFAPAASGVAST